MDTGPQRDWDWSERWDEMFNILSAEPRRMILFALLNEPPGRRLPLPEAAESPNQSIDSEMLALKLRHHHLPKLVDMGYVMWEDDPFCVQRGPDFAEPAFILGLVNESIDDIPPSLVENCRVIAEMVGNGGN